METLEPYEGDQEEGRWAGADQQGDLLSTISFLIKRAAQDRDGIVQQKIPPHPITWITGRWAEQIHIHSPQKLPNHASCKGAESVQVRTLEALIGRAGRHEDEQRQICTTGGKPLFHPNTHNTSFAMLLMFTSRILQCFDDFLFCA